MARRIIYFLFVILLVSCGKSSGDSEPATVKEEPHETRADSVGRLVTAVRNSSRIYTSEYRIHKIITHSDELKVQGSILGLKYKFGVPAGHRRIAIPVEGTMKGYIDFSHFTADNVIYEGDRIEIVLPDPEAELTSTKVNHKEIKSYVALLRSDFSEEELSSYARQGRDSIIASVGELKMGERTRASAVRLLRPIITRLGFSPEQVVITFRKDFDERRLKVITD